MGGVGSGPSPRYTIEEARELVRLMREERKPLIQAADARGIPLATAHALIHRHEETRDAYRDAQEALADHYAHGALEAVEQGVALVLSPDVDAKRANAVASATRNLSERRAWAAKMLAPDRYGDTVRHSGTIAHQHAVVMLPPLAQLTPPQRVTATARLSEGDADQAASAIGDGGAGDGAP